MFYNFTPTVMGGHSQNSFKDFIYYFRPKRVSTAKIKAKY